MLTVLIEVSIAAEMTTVARRTHAESELTPADEEAINAAHPWLDQL